VLVVAVVAAGCGGSGNDDGVDFGNLIASAQGPQLTREEHPDGWGRRDCFLCHPVEDIHQEDRTGTGVLPLEDIRALVARDGLESCALCHGTNGVGD
jgi:hypothetical protein